MKNHKLFAVSVFLTLAFCVQIQAQTNEAFSPDHFGIAADVFFYSLVGLVAIFALFSLWGFWRYSNLKKQIQEVERITNQISSGDTKISINQNLGNELQSTMQSLQKMSDYLNNTADTAEKIAAGNFNISVKPRSDKDRLGKAFKGLTTNLLPFVQSQEERDHLQDSIVKLLDEVSNVAEGDLTVEAEVSTEATGAIADAFNFMTAELRSLIKQVKDATNQVGSASSHINATTEKFVRGSERQSQQIAQTTAAVSDMTVSIHKVSQNAAISAKVASNSLENARQGSQAVQDNISAMMKIRGQVQETAKRIKRLGERSQEIGEIVQIIDELSEQTSLLALNASLQAAAAGEAGRGFVVVAEEVERLAERSNKATKQISNLTQAIQHETKDVVASMEETIKEVVAGSGLATKAGQTLVEIEKVSQQLAELIATISTSANQQAQSSQGISKSMIEISEVTQLVLSGAKQANDSVKGLVLLAEKLRGSVSTFKLPEDGPILQSKNLEPAYQLPNDGVIDHLELEV